MISTYSQALRKKGGIKPDYNQFKTAPISNKLLTRITPPSFVLEAFAYRLGPLIPLEGSITPVYLILITDVYTTIDTFQYGNMTLQLLALSKVHETDFSDLGQHNRPVSIQLSIHGMNFLSVASILYLPNCTGVDAMLSPKCWSKTYVQDIFVYCIVCIRESLQVILS